MSGELTKRLVHSRHYCADRLVEVKQDLAGLQTEANVLKARLETAGDEIEAGQIRRRRRFLGRRLDELKAERAALTAELQAATDQLNDAPAQASNEWQASTIGYAAGATIPSDEDSKPAAFDARSGPTP
jgi:hypothetical protein